MDRKKRILFVGEASYLATGFSTYWHEVIKRLYNTGEFEIAELGSYGEDGDSRITSLPWKFYPVAPNKNDAEGQQIYRSNQINQFGLWRFNATCLDFKPDIVLSIRDYWMDEFIDKSPFRKNFIWYWMLTIDGIPQRDLWLDIYKRCDGCLTYSKWAWDVMQKDCLKETNMITVASPGSDLDIFKPPEDKKAHKLKLGIDPNTIIVGTVMRNQKRKLYYDLIEAFSKWVYKAKTKGHIDLVKKTFLYLHTSYPDVGYDIGRAITEFKIGNKVLMTYMCETCGTVYPSFFQGDWAICRRCKNKTAHPPNANLSPSREVLAEIMKTFDLYVQYSVCLHPSTPIMTMNGWENIENIKIGDKVVGKDGNLHRVYKIMRNKSDRCFDIISKTRPWAIIATDNHPWLVVDRTGLSKGIESIVNKERYYSNNETTCPELNLVYKRTDELIPGDLLATRVPLEEILPNYDLPFMDEDMAYYLGLFVADGHANETCGLCTISSNSSEAKHVFEISNKIAQKIGKDAKQQSVKNRNAVVTNICDTKLRDVFRKICYKDKDKTLPYGCYLWPKNLQIALIKGLIFGDGYQKKESLNVYCTTSQNVAKTLCTILERIGWYYSCSVQFRDNDDNLVRQPMFRFEIRTDGQRKSHETLYKNGFVLTKIKSCGLSDYSDDVINIDIEDDHNYNTICGMSHNCEGWGMPLTDAMACGVPCMAVRYSAMEDHLLCPTSIPIEVGRYFYESILETEQRRALPNNDDFVQKLDRFTKFSYEKRQELSKQTREYAVEKVDVYGQEEKMSKFSWDRTAAIWKNILDKCEIKDPNLTWFNPIPQLIKPNLMQSPDNLDNVQFINWVMKNIWCRPEMINSYFAFEWMKYLNCGFMIQGTQRIGVNRQYIINHFINLINNQNKAEEQRIVILNPNKSEINFQVM